ncbi:MAG: sodium:proton antiporter, partial [Clostridium sp.]|nr:sodium:proton antiporter [Clostridium sp.]
DVFVIVLFSAFTGLAQGAQVSAASFVQIPLSILAGILIGAAVGILLAVYFKKMHIRDTVKVIILLCISFVLVSLEDSLKGVFSFSSLISVMCMGIALQKKREPVARRLSLKFNKLWVGAEILLFVLVGATVDISYAAAAGGAAVLLILGVLVFRMAGVMCCLVGTKLNLKERMFCMAAYMPKATVQAAIGGVPLSMGLACGNIVLTVAVLAILITAPLGAFLVDLTYRRWLTQEY